MVAPRPSLDPAPELQVVRSLLRAAKAAGYYEKDHPAITETLREAQAVLARLTRDGELQLGAAGRGLVFDEDAPLREDELSRALAELCFERSVVALSFGPDVEVADLAALTAVLVESPDRLRARGGARLYLDTQRAHGIELVEVDFGSVFEGRGLEHIQDGEGVVGRALREILRFQAGKPPSAGEALGLRFDALVSPGSLGDFLDELIDASDASLRVRGDAQRRRAADRSPGQGRILSGKALTLDDLADVGAEAYLYNQDQLRAEGEEALLGSAQALSAALARLSPEARFQLIRRLAAGESLDGARSEAVGHLGESLDPRLLVEAMAGVLSVDRDDSAVSQAIGQVLKRMYPVESERLRILDAVDRDLGNRGQPLGGALWQELRARAFEKEGYGMLQLGDPGLVQKMGAYARARFDGKRPRIPGDENLEIRGEHVRDHHLGLVLAAVLRDARALAPPLLQRALELVESLERGGRGRESLRILALLAERTEGASDPALEDGLRRLLTGPEGQPRFEKLIESLPNARSRFLGELILGAIEATPEPAQRHRLTERLATFEPSTLELLAESAVHGTQARAVAMFDAVRRSDPRLLLLLGRHALRAPHSRVRELAVRRLAAAQQPGATALLATVAGAKGDEAARRALGLERDKDPRTLEELQFLALSALGSTRSAEVIPILNHALQRTSLLPDKHVEAVRVEAAKALLQLGLPEARALVEEAARSKKKLIRDAAERALFRRPGNLP